MCNCRSCKQARRIKRTIMNGSHRQKNRLIQELAELYWYTDADLDYEKAVADGSWPTAVEVLERRLKNAKERRNEHEIRTRQDSHSVSSGD